MVVAKDTTVSVNGKEQTGWLFEETMLDANHLVAVAVKPAEVVNVRKKCKNNENKTKHDDKIDSHILITSALIVNLIFRLADSFTMALFLVIIVESSICQEIYSGFQENVFYPKTMFD